MVKVQEKHPLDDRAKDIEKHRRKLSYALESFRGRQIALMPLVIDYVVQESKTPTQPEVQKLWMPSDLSIEERKQLKIEKLSKSEQRLRVGHAYDCIMKVQRRVKEIGAVKTDKEKNDRQQKQNTKTTDRLNTLFNARDLAIAEYNANREALIALQYLDDAFPPLMIKDTFRKNTFLPRAIGDSRVMDGSLWGRKNGQSSKRIRLGDNDEKVVEWDDKDADEGVH